jgi:hypothetical protein
MHQIQLSDEAYESLHRAAALRGLATVEEYIAEVALRESKSDDDDLVLSPEQLIELDRISASIAAGARTYTSEEVRDSLAEHKAAWLKKNAS